ncbi:predicted protein [Histoplasma capsulatum G186AR]|uniref:Uncharacterized protein n=1 Tax=Ajellomyces capsulatus (strain G186AR / H82 / ATCC MYA-2454 / RMSCC 2432) TaxID=447093 RepID=C0NCB1_AJECG|nr:uncharacterized protein HCBG_00757 [Histoplasma capsulatum G186AR]EEH11302.1 predicted protein [Histoplasma capsulatum G186AR]
MTTQQPSISTGKGGFFSIKAIRFNRKGLAAVYDKEPPYSTGTALDILRGCCAADQLVHQHIATTRNSSNSASPKLLLFPFSLRFLDLPLYLLPVSLTRRSPPGS